MPKHFPARKADSPPDSPAGFEAALSALETLVARMEAGDLPLEESLQEYQRGMQLVHRCQQALDQAQARMQQLLAEPGEPGPATETGAGSVTDTEPEPAAGSVTNAEPEPAVSSAPAAASSAVPDLTMTVPAGPVMTQPPPPLHAPAEREDGGPPPPPPPPPARQDADREEDLPF
jgi:exodeoxyribonuclease VII small subunit